jgi:signal transduction histidine kinase
LSKSIEKPETEAQRLARELAKARQALIDEIVIHEGVVEDLKRSNLELRKSQERTDLMLRSVQEVSSSLELDLVLERIAETLAFATGMPHCGIYLMEEEKNVLIRHAGTRNLSAAQNEALKRLHIPPGDFPLIQEALDARKAVLCVDARSDPRVNHDILPPMDIRTMLVVPIRLSERVLGVALNYTMEDRFDIAQDEIELAGGVASLLGKNNLKDVLEIICNEALNLTDATGSAVLLLTDSDTLKITSAVGEILNAMDRLPIHGSLAGRAVLSGEPTLFNDVASLGLEYLRDRGINSLLAAPLKVEASTIGVLDVINKVGGFTKEDVRIISLFADQAAIVINQTQLHQQVEQMAVMEERQRLARELHDSVTQALYSVNLYAEAARRSLTAGKKKVTQENLKKLREMTREALLEMRLLVFELHPSILEKEGLVATLQARLAAVESRSGVKTEITVEGERRLPLTIEEELYRIAQEGLNNAVKHAQARSIRIDLRYTESNVRLELRDDGQGFDQKAADELGGLGLRGIKERVRKMNGSLSIESSPEAGTRLTVAVNTSE